jgi:microcystin-dependent protein
MPLVNPSLIPPFAGDLPDPSDRVTYGVRGRAMWSWETETLVPAANALGTAAYNNAIFSRTMAEQAAATAGFAGEWSSLSGPLAMPASVYHDDLFWVLLDDVSNVESHEPGVSQLWLLFEDTASQFTSTFVGMIGLFAASAVSAPWLHLNGAALTRLSYPELWTYAQASGNLVAQGSKQAGNFGTGDGSTTFTLPDYRGEFPRFWDGGRGVDVGREIGTAQSHALQQGTFDLRRASDQSTVEQAASGSITRADVAGSSAGTVTANAATGSLRRITIGSGTETRPRNVALIAAIRYE